MNSGPVGPFRWDAEALQAFTASLEETFDPDDIGGKNARAFASRLASVDASLLPDARIPRSTVFALAQDSTIPTATTCAAALAWGGMNQRFHRKLFDQAGEGWLSVAEDIRAGQLDRKTAYDQLSDLSHKDRLHGLGPAFFTKLIYFLTPSPDSVSQPYIMDQWAGCSVNLLVGRELVRMDVTRQWPVAKPDPVFSFQVSQGNTGAEYELFCSAVEQLRQELDLKPDMLDRAMIANGGKKKSSWRQYVIQNRRI